MMLLTEECDVNVKHTQRPPLKRSTLEKVFQMAIERIVFLASPINNIDSVIKWLMKHDEIAMNNKI